jgi:hypothetical protein
MVALTAFPVCLFMVFLMKYYAYSRKSVMGNITAERAKETVEYAFGNGRVWKDAQGVGDINNLHRAAFKSFVGHVMSVKIKPLD